MPLSSITYDWQYNNNGDYDNIEATADFVTDINGGFTPLLMDTLTTLNSLHQLRKLKECGIISILPIAFFLLITNIQCVSKITI